MKLLYKTEKYKRYCRRVSRKAHKKRTSSTRKQRLDRKNTQGLSRAKRKEWYIRKHYKVIVRAPKNSAFLDDPNSVVIFINKLETALEQNSSLYVDMEKVAKIDYPMIAALLAVLNRSKKKGIKINGNMPDDINSKIILRNSGFLYTLFSENPDAGHKYDIGVDNQLFTLDTRDLSVVKEIEHSVAECVLDGTKKLPGGLYTTLGELMDNTATHAAEQKGGTERWWLSINYNRKDKKVGFVFIDYGIGIFTSLSSKTEEHPVRSLLEQAKLAFGIDAVESHLKAIVTESAAEAYKLPDGRGEGIYGIYQAFQRDELKNLYIISNNAFGDIRNNSYKKLKKQLNGTLYYWEVCDNTI